MTNNTPNPYKGHRFPAEIISHCDWLYFNFPLSFRDIEQMIHNSWDLRHLRDDKEVVQEVWARLCIMNSAVIVHNRAISGIKGKVVITSDGQKYYLRRAVDSQGNVVGHWALVTQPP